MIDKKYLNEFLNSDDNDAFVSKGAWINASNIRLGSTDSGTVGVIESIGSTIATINAYVPSGTNISIGSVEDQARGRLINFNWNSGELHGIYCYDPALDITYKVLLDSQVTGGLLFNSSFRIDKNAKVIGDLLFFTDYKNEPRCINIEAGIKMNHGDYETNVLPYTSPLKYTTITLIKRPPIFPVTWTKNVDGTNVNNFTGNNAYQFTYRYVYRDNQISALSAYSALVPLNFAADTFNRIDITIPGTELIDDDIFALELCAKIGNFGKTFIIKRWDKDFDAAAITAHNSGTPLTFEFFDDTVGEVLDDVVSNQPFDDVPLLSKTLEVAKNRIFLGNDLFGYNTPLKTSLTTEVIDSTDGGDAVAGVWGYVTLHANWAGSGACADPYSYPFVFVASTGNFYYFPAVRVSSTNWNGASGYAPDISGVTTRDILDATATGSSEAAFVTVLKLFSGYPSTSGCTFGTPQWQVPYSVSYTYSGTSYDVSLLSTGAGFDGFFKSASTYKVTLSFYDRFRRKCGVIRQNTSNYIAERIYTQTTFSSVIQWMLSNDDAVDEIPDWAWYYQIEITKNQTTRFFVQGRTTGANYVTKDATGVIVYPTTPATFAIGTTYATAINISALNSFGLGYEFNDGDLIRIGTPGDVNIVLRVIGQDGNFVLCNPHDIGSLDDTTVFLVEIFTPYKPSTIEPYYEIGPVYVVNDPGTVDRTYSVTTGLLNGDAYALERDYDISTSYVVEAMSPNDKFWQQWQTDTGWVNILDTLGQKLKTSTYVFSDTYVSGTKINGLNKFQPLNSEDVGSEAGIIQKLQLTSKRQEDGTVMLCICKNQTISIYLGESQLVGSTSNAFIAKSDGVVGTSNTLKGNCGTSHPESVVEFRGEVYWFAIDNDAFVQYSVNGIDSISAYKLERFSRLFSTHYRIANAGEGPLYIIGGVDPYHKEILWSIPQVEDSNPKGTLPDMNIDYPYDFYDAAAKTIVYKIKATRWMGSYSFTPEQFNSIGDDLYSWQGLLWKHNDPASTNNFYSVGYESKIMLICNAESSAIKVFTGIYLEANQFPDFIHLRSEFPYIQSSMLIDVDYKTQEGVLYAPIYRDRLSPSLNAPDDNTYDYAELNGDKMRNTALRVMLVFANNMSLKFVNIEYHTSWGHKV